MDKLKLEKPKILILLFVLIVLIVPFYESKRVAIWESQRKTFSQYPLVNIFRSAVLLYTSQAQEMKAEFGLTDFFEKENSLWLKIKKSPLVFQEEIIQEELSFGQKLESELQPQPEPQLEQVDEVPPVTIGETEEIPLETERPKPEPTLKPANIEAPFRILIIGDSFIAVGGGVGDILEKGLLNNYQEIAVFRQGKVSSGLSRPDYFNWPLTIHELISQYKPNIAVIMLGSNDAQGLTNSKGIFQIYYGQPGWNQKYAQRVADLLNIF